MERLDLLLAGPPVGAVMLHIRVSMVMQSRLLMTRYGQGRPRLSFNPALFQRGHARFVPSTPGDGRREPDAYGDRDRVVELRASGCATSPTCSERWPAWIVGP